MGLLIGGNAFWQDGRPPAMRSSERLAPTHPRLAPSQLIAPSGPMRLKQSARTSWPSNVTPGGRQAVRLDPNHPAEPVQSDTPQQGLGHHVDSDVARMAVSGDRDGSVLAQDLRLIRGYHDPPRARARCRDDSRAPTATARCRDSLGSRHPLRTRCSAAPLSIQSPGAEYGPKGELLGQRGGRIALQ